MSPRWLRAAGWWCQAKPSAPSAAQPSRRKWGQRRLKKLIGRRGAVCCCWGTKEKDGPACRTEPGKITQWYPNASWSDRPPRWRGNVDSFISHALGFVNTLEQSNLVHKGFCQAVYVSTFCCRLVGKNLIIKTFKKTYFKTLFLTERFFVKPKIVILWKNSPFILNRVEP